MECLRAHSLEGKTSIILLLSGGFGVGPIEKLYCALLDVDLPLEIVVVSGRKSPVRPGGFSKSCTGGYGAQKMIENGSSG